MQILDTNTWFPTIQITPDDIRQEGALDAGIQEFLEKETPPYFSAVFSDSDLQGMYSRRENAAYSEALGDAIHVFVETTGNNGELRFNIRADYPDGRGIKQVDGLAISQLCAVLRLVS